MSSLLKTECCNLVWSQNFDKSKQGLVFISDPHWNGMAIYHHPHSPTLFIPVEWKINCFHSSPPSSYGGVWVFAPFLILGTLRNPYNPNPNSPIVCSFSTVLQFNKSRENIPWRNCSQKAIFQADEHRHSHRQMNSTKWCSWKQHCFLLCCNMYMNGKSNNQQNEF